MNMKKLMTRDVSRLIDDRVTAGGVGHCDCDCERVGASAMGPGLPVMVDIWSSG
jgi:hypothetical protein